MFGRFIGLVAGLALLSEGYLLWRPQSVGVVAPPDLGPFTAYQPVVAGLAALIGVAVIVAAMQRAPGEPKSKRKGPPPVVDWNSVAEEAPGRGGAGRAPPPPSLLTPNRSPSVRPARRGPGTRRGPCRAGRAGPRAPRPPRPSSPPPPPRLNRRPPPRRRRPTRAAFLAAMDEGDRLRAADRLGDAIEPYSDALALARALHAAAPSDPLAAPRPGQRPDQRGRRARPRGPARRRP